MRINLTETGESVMLLMEKQRENTKPNSAFKPQSSPCTRALSLTSESPNCGAFLFPSVSISHNRDFSQVHLSSGKSLQTNCNVQFSSSEWRKPLGQRPTPDDLDLHHFQKSIPPNDQISIRDGSVRRARLIPFPYFGSQLISCKLKMQGIKA